MEQEIEGDQELDRHRDSKTGRFAAGPPLPKTIQRRGKGIRNKITRDLKEGIIHGAVAYGSDGAGAGGLNGYMEFLAARYPKSYTGLLAKLLPYVVKADVDHTMTNHQVVVVSIPKKTHFTKEQIDKLPTASLDDIASFVDEAHSKRDDAYIVDGEYEVNPTEAVGSEPSTASSDQRSAAREDTAIGPEPQPEPAPDDKVVVIAGRKRRDPSGPPSQWPYKGAFD